MFRQGLSQIGHLDGLFSGSSKRLLNSGPDVYLWLFNGAVLGDDGEILPLEAVVDALPRRQRGYRGGGISDFA